MQALTQRLNRICEEQPFTTSFFVRDLTTGAEAARAGDVVVPSASTRKTSILMHALAAVHAGRLDLKEPCTVEARLQKDVASGTYQHMTPGTVLPLRDAMVNMIITSDNVCTQLVLERLDREALNAWCRRIGMAGTTHRANIPPAGLAWDHPLEATATTTPADQARLLELMLRGAEDAEAAAVLGCSPELCRLGLDILSWQRLRNLIPSLLPASTKVAHKTGRDARGRSDAGIVYRDGRPLFILAAYADRVPEEMPDGLPGFATAYATVGRLARACWDGIGK
ncbi:serine hydrolase [Siccirubricoccus sp. G192]|uniref:serine hydrolase n=1 Tax=Siccirubricoccus sp. G192 TaxID=2849651 RepID=UPI001C2CAC4E|nr:serine hydrolase [Siccirubricoccus sp. G192]MBV1797745.1 serine hydrolase [Siccirubricoccus sp. G192]